MSEFLPVGKPADDGAKDQEKHQFNQSMVLQGGLQTKG